MRRASEVRVRRSHAEAVRRDRHDGRRAEGAFELFSGANGSIEGAGNALGATASGATKKESRTLSADGKESACVSSRADSQPPDGCAAAIRLELSRLGEGPPPVAALDLGQRALVVAKFKPPASLDLWRMRAPWAEVGWPASDATNPQKADAAWRAVLGENPPKPMAAEVEWQVGMHALNGLDGTLDDAVTHFTRSAELGQATFAQAAKYELMYALTARGNFRQPLPLAFGLMNLTGRDDSEVRDEGRVVASRIIAQIGGLERAPLETISPAVQASLAMTIAADALASDDWFSAQRAFSFVLEKAPLAWEAPEALDRLLDLSSQMGASKRAQELAIQRSALFAPKSAWFAAQKKNGKTDVDIAKQLAPRPALILSGIDDASSTRVILGSMRRALDTCWGLVGTAAEATLDLSVEPVQHADAKVKVTLSPEDGRAPAVRKCIETMAATTLADAPTPVHVRIGVSYAQGPQDALGWRGR